MCHKIKTVSSELQSSVKSLREFRKVTLVIWSSVDLSSLNFVSKCNEVKTSATRKFWLTWKSWLNKINSKNSKHLFLRRGNFFFSAFDPSRNSKKFCCSFGGRALSSFKHTRRLFWMEEYHIMSGNRLHWCCCCCTSVRRSVSKVNWRSVEWPRRAFRFFSTVNIQQIVLY